MDKVRVSYYKSGKLVPEEFVSIELDGITNDATEAAEDALNKKYPKEDISDVYILG